MGSKRGLREHSLRRRRFGNLARRVAALAAASAAAAAVGVGMASGAPGVSDERISVRAREKVDVTRDRDAEAGAGVRPAEAAQACPRYIEADGEYGEYIVSNGVVAGWRVSCVS